MDTQTLKLIGLIIGYVAVAEGFLIFLSSRRDRILIFKFIADVLWSVSYLLQGNYTGGILNAIAMGREAVFYNRDKHKWASSRLWLVFFLIVTMISPMYSLISGKEGWYAVLPAIGSLAAVIGFYSRSANVSRYIGLFANGVWMIYNILSENLPATLSSAILLLSGVVGTVMMLVQRHQIKKATITSEGVTPEKKEEKESPPL